MYRQHHTEAERVMLGHEKTGLVDRTASRTDLKLMHVTVDASLTTGRQAQAPSVHIETCVAQPECHTTAKSESDFDML